MPRCQICGLVHKRLLAIEDDKHGKVKLCPSCEDGFASGEEIDDMKLNLY